MHPTLFAFGWLEMYYSYILAGKRSGLGFIGVLKVYDG